MSWFLPRNPWHYHIRYASGDTGHSFINLFQIADYIDAEKKFEETVRSIKKRTHQVEEFHGRYSATFPDGTVVMLDHCDKDCMKK